MSSSGVAGNLALNLAPVGVIQSNTYFALAGYGCTCTPQGHSFHQYVITFFALKINKLGLDKTANLALVGYYLNGATLAKASIVMYYKR